MYKISKTDQDSVQPKALLGESFSRSYSRYAETQEALPPDTATLVCTIISMVMLIWMFVLTSRSYTGEAALWYVFAALAAAIMGYSIYKYIKTRNAYLKAAGKPSTINDKRNEYFGLFGGEAELSEKVLAGDFQDQVKKLAVREQDEVVKNALKDVYDDLTRRNNPDLPVCRLITPLPELFSQPRARLYMKKDGDDFIFFDFNWANPQGEIRCTEDDIVSFGKFSAYPSSINTSGGKIRPESVIVEIAGEGEKPLYLDFVDTEFDKAVKLLPKKKEKK